MPTIIDVAKRAGVSKSTISRYLNGEQIRKENKIKIEKAIEEMNYHINPIARGLKTSKTYTIGVIITNITDLFVTYIIQACEQILNDEGYSIILCDSRENLEVEKDRLLFLCNKRVDGIIIQPSSDEGNHIQEVIKSGIPVVLIDRMIQGLFCDCIVVDNFGGAYGGVESLIKKGHKDIAIIKGPDTIYTARERFKGYKKALRDYGIKENKRYIVNGDFVKEGGRKAFIKIMNIENDRPTAIFISNYFMTIGIIEMILGGSYSIPEDISIIAFDNVKGSNTMDLSAITKPRLSTVYQPIGEIGKKAGELIISRVEYGEGDYVPKIITLPTSLNLTDSIANILV
ncbi:MAG TPA: LacI family DNA-binding transcriptional regulator [Clostridia bacterium]|nr:LacI family DNA-binding transcriptional regulator [Clostridia bacterium]